MNGDVCLNMGMASVSPGTVGLSLRHSSLVSLRLCWQAQVHVLSGAQSRLGGCCPGHESPLAHPRSREPGFHCACLGERPAGCGEPRGVEREHAGLCGNSPHAARGSGDRQQGGNEPFPCRL